MTELPANVEAIKDRHGRNSAPPRLLSAGDLEALPDLGWRIDGLVPESGMGVIFAPSGGLKSFLALDWALSVTTGTPWLGHDVKPCPVVYLAAEGRGGLKQRVRAWQEAHGSPDLGRARWLLDTVDLRERGSRERARQAIAALPWQPGLIVVDTMARTMPGGDENAARDVGEFVAGVDELRGDGLALVVHHTGKDGGQERGSGALRAAADLMVRLKREAPALEVVCDYLRDAEEWPPLALRSRPCLDSLVLELADHSKPEVRDDLCERVLAYVQERGPCSKNAVEGAVTGRASAIREALSALERDGLTWQSPDGIAVRLGVSDDPGTNGTRASGGGSSGREDTPRRGALPGRTPTLGSSGTFETGDAPLIACTCHPEPSRLPWEQQQNTCRYCLKPLIAKGELR